MGVNFLCTRKSDNCLLLIHEWVHLLICIIFETIVVWSELHEHINVSTSYKNTKLYTKLHVNGGSTNHKKFLFEFFCGNETGMSW